MGVTFTKLENTVDTKILTVAKAMICSESESLCFMKLEDLTRSIILELGTGAFDEITFINDSSSNAGVMKSTEFQDSTRNSNGYM